MNLTPQRAMRAAVAVPGVPRDEDGPVFREPWEARAFAMALALHEAGVFTWKEWAETLGAQIKRAQAAGADTLHRDDADGALHVGVGDTQNPFGGRLAAQPQLACDPIYGGSSSIWI